MENSESLKEAVAGERHLTPSEAASINDYT